MARDAMPAYIKTGPKGTPNQLQELRAQVAKVRDLKLEIDDTDKRLKERRQDLEQLERKTLPDLFNKVGISEITLDPEGNLPGYEAKREQYVHASIAAGWPEEKREAAFKYLQANGGGDLIKTEITITLPMKSTALRKTVLAAIKKLKVPHSVTLTVPWASLTAFIRETIKHKKKLPPLDVLGADVGEIVRLKPRQPK